MYMTVGGQRVWYERSGIGSTVVLLHGLGDSHDLWRHQVGSLSSVHDVVAIDLPGHGRSEIGGRDLTVALMADTVVGLLEALNVSRPVIVGLSMGGGVAQAIAVSRPWLPAALVLVSTSSELPQATRERMIIRARRAERDGMAAVVEQTVPRWFTPEFTAREPGEVARTRCTVLCTAPSAFGAASRANAARELTNGLDRIQCPVLFVGGADDPADPLRAVKIYQERLRAVRTMIIPGASHLVPVEAPAQFNKELLRFIGEVESTGDARGEGGEQS